MSCIVFISEIRYRRELENLHLRPKHAADIHRRCAQIRHDSHASHVGRPSRRPVSRVEHGMRQSGVSMVDQLREEILANFKLYIFNGHNKFNETNNIRK